VRWRGALNREAIDHCKGRDLPAKLAQEVDILGCGGTCLGTEPEVRVDLIAAGGHAQSSDDGELLESARALRQEGSWAAGRPAWSDKGGHQQAGFVEEDEAGSQADGSFRTRPLLFDPALDLGLVPLNRPALWLLGAPTEIAQERHPTWST